MVKFYYLRLLHKLPKCIPSLLLKFYSISPQNPNGMVDAATFQNYVKSQPQLLQELLHVKLF